MVLKVEELYYFALHAGNPTVSEGAVIGWMTCVVSTDRIGSRFSFSAVASDCLPACLSHGRGSVDAGEAWAEVGCSLSD